MAQEEAPRGSGMPDLPKPLSLEQFEQGVTLGTGSFGRVRFATHTVRGASARRDGRDGVGQATRCLPRKLGRSR